MPELPEVEITKQGIEPFLLGQTIKQFTVRNRKLRWPIPVKLHQTLQNLVIQAVSRRGKYILIDCTVGWLIIHLGMSGSLRVLTSKEETCFFKLSIKDKKYKLKPKEILLAKPI